MDISASVGIRYGKQCPNTHNDQLTVRELLNRIPGAQGGRRENQLTGPIQTGIASPALHQAILAFQDKHKAQGLVVDGHVDPGQRTIALLKQLAGPQTPGGKPAAKKATAWINAFIPRDVSGVTFPVQNGPFRGSTYVFAPPTNGSLFPPAFLTNNRTFLKTNNRAISFYKMHADVTVEFPGSSRIVDRRVFGGECIQVDASTGSEVRRAVSASDRMSVKRAPVASNPIFQPSPNSIAIQFELAAGNPLVPLATTVAAIDLVGTMTIDPDKRVVAFDGFVDHFPAFECYLSVDDGAPLTIFNIFPLPGFSPLNLFGPATRRVNTVFLPF